MKNLFCGLPRWMHCATLSLTMAFMAAAAVAAPGADLSHAEEIEVRL